MRPQTLAERAVPSPVAAVPQHQTDYALIRSAILFLSNRWSEHPPLDALAAHLGLSPAHCQKLFKRWCGLSPKEFVQAIALDRARQLLEASASVLDVAHEVGLSGGSRLHDLFVTHEAMTPGDYKRRGAGLTITWGFHATPFGEALVMTTARGICGVGFVDDDRGQTRAEALADMTGRWPQARFLEDVGATAASAQRVFDPAQWRADRPLRLVLIGSDFETQVWQQLLRVPMGRTVSYGGLAHAIGKPAAARAVGSAVGRNPISFAVPCHRVVRGDGGLGGYHWGLTRKRALIGWEVGRLATG